MRSKKALSMLLVSAMLISLLAATPLMVNAAPGDVCEITESGVQYASLDDALRAITSGQTIKLLADITYPGQITIRDMSITFDLNGHTLEAEALLLYHGGKALLAKPTNGEFNLSGAATVTGHTVSVDGVGSMAEVTNITGSLDEYHAVYASSGSEVIVYGNVTNTGCNNAALFSYDCSEITVHGNVTNTGSRSEGLYAEDRGKITVKGDVRNTTETQRGASVSSGGEITIDGLLSVPAGEQYYIWLDGTDKTQAEYTTPTTKAGYLSYTDGTSTVWVKERPICGDVNNDGTITMNDVTQIYLHFRGKITLTGNALVAADVNKDGKVTMNDVTRVYLFFRGKITSLD